MTLREKILYAIKKCEDELNGQNRYSMIPSILIGMKEMLKNVDEGMTDKNKRAKSMAGLWKIVSDNYYFEQSDIGKAVIDAMNTYEFG